MSTPATTLAGPPDVLHGEPATRPLTTLTLAELRARRRVLRDESQRASHWHRLARARLDLVVAGALGHDVGPRSTAPSEVDDDRADDAPCFEALRELLLGDGLTGSDVVERLRRLDDATRVLRGYDGAVRAAADEATLELVRRYREKPETCLGGATASSAS